jgi:hypothetical protein
MTRNATYIFTDPESAVRLMTRRGACILKDRVTSTLVRKLDRSVRMARQVAALVNSYLPYHLASYTLATPSDGKDVQR